MNSAFGRLRAVVSSPDAGFIGQKTEFTTGGRALPGVSDLRRRRTKSSKRKIPAMIEIKSRIEEKSARIQRQKERALDEREEARSERAEKIARLRSLRLVKEASEKIAADRSANGSAGTKKRPRRLPQAHRR